MHADYTQLELCMVMYVTADQDIYTQMASQLFGVPTAEVTPAQRRLAKEHNFARCYGSPHFHPNKSVTNPSRGSLFLTQAEAARVTEHYFESHPWMRDFRDAFYPEPK
jgi:DNA polymerase-1